MKLTRQQLTEMDSRYRATLINSLAGFKQAVLVGTRSAEGYSNLAIFNSLIHIGANPPYYGLLFRPDTVRRDTLSYILETGEYTFNYVKADDFIKAHKTSAKYPRGESEFIAAGFSEEYKENCAAPFVKEAVVKIAMKLEERQDIKINGTILIIGSIQSIDLSEALVLGDGFVALHREDVLACAGLDAYYTGRYIGRLSYARPGDEPVLI